MSYDISSMSDFDIEHVARLARLKLNETEKQKFTQEIGEILNYVDQLEKTDTSGVTSVTQISGLENVVREDKIANDNNREKLLANAPEQKDGYIVVKKVFE